MANRDMIARLADLREFSELKRHFVDVREEEIQKLTRKTFALPAEHDQLEWERKKAFFDGVAAVFSTAEKARDSQRKESQ